MSKTKKGPEPTDVHVGARVRMRRMMLGMSQETLADKIGLTFQQVQKYEKGTNRISASRLQQIATILQVPVSFFFDGAPAPTIDGKVARLDLAGSPDVATTFFTLPYAAELAEHYIAIAHNADRHVVLEVARAIAKPPAAKRKAAA